MKHESHGEAGRGDAGQRADRKSAGGGPRGVWAAGGAVPGADLPALFPRGGKCPGRGGPGTRGIRGGLPEARPASRPGEVRSLAADSGAQPVPDVVSAEAAGGGWAAGGSDRVPRRGGSVDLPADVLGPLAADRGSSNGAGAALLGRALLRGGGPVPGG